MKHSISKIFKNLNTLLLISVVLGLISSFFIVEQYYSYEKMQNLKNQTEMVSNLLKEQSEFNDIKILEFNSNIAKIHSEIEKLIDLNKYNYITKMLVDDESYISDLHKLDALISNFDDHSRNYFDAEYDNDTIMKKEYEDIKSIHISIVKLVNDMIIKNVDYDNARFNLFNKLFFLLFFLILITAFWSINRLNNIYKDIVFLYSSESKKSSNEIFSQEADAISLRMKRKSTIDQNPAMIDSVTEIYNNKGMMQSYSDKKGLKESNIVSVTVLEIDNFSKSKRLFSQDFTQEILKKVAYTISLHEQVTDTIARTDYNQFTLILSRSNKEQSFKDIDIIRQSISEIRMVTPEQETINITATGGFIIKSSKSHLEDTIRKAKDLIKNAKGDKSNKILRTTDLTI